MMCPMHPTPKKKIIDNLECAHLKDHKTFPTTANLKLSDLVEQNGEHGWEKKQRK